MGKQEDFVLRALEERDVRFVRLWFTDVLGFLKSVAVAPAELEGAFAEGIGFDGSAIEGFARVYESDMLAKPDPSTFQILPWRGEGPTTARMFCDIVMPDGTPSYADPRYVLKRTLADGGRQGVHLLHPPRDRVLPVQGHPGQRRRAGAGGPQRLLRPHRAVQGRGLPARGDHDARVDGHLGGVQPPRGRPGPAGDRPAVRRRAVDRRQHHDLPHRDPGGGAQPGHLGQVHAQAVHHPPRLGHAHPRQPVRGRPERLLRGRLGVPALQDRPPVHRRHPRARAGDQRGHQPVGQQLQADDVRRRGAVVRLLGPQQPLGDDPGADVQAAQGPVHPHRAAHRRRRVQPLPRVRGGAGRRHEGHRGGPRRCPARPRTTCGRSPSGSAPASASSRCPRACNEAIEIAERSELLAETLGEHVFDFFLRNKRAEWDEYRGQVSAFERDRMLPVL